MKIILATMRLFVAALMIFTLSIFTIKIRAQSTAITKNDIYSILESSELPRFSNDSTKFSFVSAAIVNVTNIEELYSAVNNANNTGNQIVLASGVYMLSVNNPNGVARPNGGRLELQENMSLLGVSGDRGAVVIDAMNLPTSSYSTPLVNTGAIRMGKGSNSIEWLTVRNAVNGGGGIIIHLSSPGTAHSRIAHIASTGSPRGIDIRNNGAAASGYVIDAEIVDNDIYNNISDLGEGMRFVNIGANGGTISARLNGNRSHNNQIGMLIVNNKSSNASVSVTSAGDRFYENGVGTTIFGGFSSGTTAANGNMTNFTAVGSSFENNNGASTFDKGGVVVSGGENTSFPNGTSNNTANVTLRGCRLANNQLYDLGAFGARSNPVSAGLPGTNNRVKVTLFGISRNPTMNITTADSIPETPGGMNSVTINRPTSFDFDGDGKSDISVFRPSNGNWYIQQSQNGFTGLQFGNSTDKIVPADFDGDGKTDVAVYRNGIWYLRRSQLGFLGIAFGTGEDIPQPADFDGDGKSEIAVWRPSNETWYVYNLATNQFTYWQLGQNADQPVVGDYDGDGRADYAVFERINAIWRISGSSSGYDEINFGFPNDKFVPADYDGDGKTDAAVFRNGVWHILNSSSGNEQIINWGLATDIPAPADYDGDGKTDIAVFRSGTWFLQRSSQGFTSLAFGESTDKPVPNAFVP